MATMPEFIETGMAFFKGELVAASLLKAEQEKVSALTSQLAAMPVPDVAGLQARDATISELTAKVAAQASTIATLEANFVSAGRQSQQALAALGVPPVAADNKPNGDEPKGWVGLVHERIAGGKTKAEAIGFCVKNFPKEYIAAKADGSISNL